MFLGAGLGAYANAMFHLMTHAFFKALLFLAAGVVIHALVGQQDMRKMGGLRRHLPATYWAMLIGALALSGIPPLSGFFSKDSILASALASGWYGWLLAAVGFLGAFLTAVYTFRMVLMVFGGELTPFAREHLHKERGREGPLSMLVPVMVLAVLAVVGGWIQIAGIWHPLADFLHASAEPLVEPSVSEDVITSVIAVGFGTAGIVLAWLIWGARRVPVPRLRPVETLFWKKFYFDEAYEAVFYRPASWIGRAWAQWVERPLVGGSLRGVALGTRGLGGRVGAVQSGYLRTYALAIALGVAVLALVFLVTQ
jgi:NADH-quinone oxidoreductase subunit L